MIKNWSSKLLGFFPQRSGDAATQGGTNAGVLIAQKENSPAHAVFAKAESSAQAIKVTAHDKADQLVLSGEGVLKGNAAARQSLLRAAEQGDAGAQFNLGNLCHPASLSREATELGEARIEAYMWFSL